MNTQNRTSGGSRNSKKTSNSSASGGGDAATKKTDVKTEKEKSQPKPTAEQIRIAQITDCRTEDPKMREKVATLLEMTQRSEEEVCCALYECDNNIEKAAVFLLESLPVGAFEISSKKKKNRTATATTDGTNDGEWIENNNNNADNRERSRNRTTVRSRGGGSDSRGWRGREARENERNASESKGNHEGGGWRSSRGRAGGRGGYGGRGGRGGRAGPRGMGSRDSGRNYSRQQQDTQEVDTWDNAIATNAEQMKQQDAFSDAWGDWDNEEYVGSLKDTKVFTPSNLQTSNLSAPPGLEQHMVNSSHMTTDDLVQQYNTTVVSSTTTATSPGVSSVQFADMHSTATVNSSQHLTRLGLDAQQMNTSSTLSAEQSQYFNSLPSQTSNQQTNVNSYKNPSVQYQTSYVPNNVFVDQSGTAQPSVRRARAKIPPPSKIPSTAVEMPGDTLNNIGYLDVQFGGLDFAADESFDALTEKFNATTIESQQNVQAQEVTGGEYSTKSSTQQASLPSTLQTSPMIPNSDTLSASQTDSLSSSYPQRTPVNVSQQSTGVGSSITTSVSSTLDQLSKTSDHPYNQSSSSNAAGYQNSYNSNSSANKPSYQSSGSTHGYNNSNYSSSTQVSSGNSYQSSSNSAYNTYNQNSVNTYQQQSSASANNATNSTSGSAANSSSGTQNIPVGGTNSAVNNSSSNTNAGYLSNQYQSNPSSSTFATQQSGYQNSSQSVYGTSGLANNSGFSGSTNTSSSQYSNFNTTKLKETSASASTHFESATSSGTVSSTVNSVSNSSVTTNSMSSPSLGLTNTKVTNSTAKSTAGILPNIQMVSQYIQTGLPYYQQPAVYSYEDIQMMQQRMPHVTQYYDINYPPTSLGAAGVRDANLGSVAYSTMTDGRFTRTDNNSSPVSNVSSTMSQQAGSSGPMLNVPYAYFYGGNMMPGGFQYGTPAIYPQQMPTANATSGGQFPKPSYNSGYGSTSYDALGQATQDYSKGAYASSGVSQQSKAQNVSNTPQAASASDITSSMYGKSHVALNKVNSYDKQSFHSGTPPPFNLTGTQTAAATSAQPYGMYIQPMPAAHHNMNMHQPMHQDSSSAGQRQQGSGQKASGTKQGYSPSYWAAQN